MLYILAGLGVIFAYYLLQAVWSGFSSTAAPSTQVQKAQCIAQCRKDSLSPNCDQYCLEQSLNK